MKSLILILVLAMSTSMVICDSLADIQQISKACLAEARVTEDELKKFFQNGMKPAEATDNIKCHMKCVMEKKGHLKNGLFDETAALNSMKSIPQLKDHQAEIERAIHDCKNERGTNDCDTAFKITMCLAEYKSNSNNS